MTLKITRCTYKSAKYAVLNWHYSKAMPAGKLVKYGVWEDKMFVGAIIFGRGANNNAHKYFKCEITECCELVRVALRRHTFPVTKLISIALKLLKTENPGLKLVFSYADETNQGHKGVIYKAGNWEYLGERKAQGGSHWILKGKMIHNRTMSSRYGSRENFPKEAKFAPPQIKHLFVYRFSR